MYQFLFLPQLIDTQIQRGLEDTFSIFQPLLLSTSQSKRISIDLIRWFIQASEYPKRL